MHAFIDTVLDYDPVRSRVDIACSCVRLLEALPLERAVTVARHALNFGNVHYRELKRIIEHHLGESDDAIAVSLASHAWGDAQPVFARTGEDYLERIDVRSSPVSDVQTIAAIPFGVLSEQEVKRGTA